MTTAPALPYSFDTEADLLDEAIGALRISGRIVQRVADPEGCYRVDGGAPLTSGAIVALALDLMPLDEGHDPNS